MNTQAFFEGEAAIDALHAHQVVLFAVAALAELRESDTASHLLRVTQYVRLLAEKLQQHPGLAPQLSSAYIEALCTSAPVCPCTIWARWPYRTASCSSPDA